MKTFLCVLIVLFVFSPTVYSATLDITNDDVFAGSITNINGFPMSQGNTIEVNYVFNPGEIRGFAEFNLQPWYDLNLNTSKINSIEFIATYQGDLFEGVIAVHDMLTREDGTFGANLADFNASLSLIQGNITKSSYNPELIVDVKSAILADIDASQQWTGIAVKLNALGTWWGATFYGENTSEFQPILRIDYQATAIPVPEPASLLLLGLAVFGLARRRYRR